MGVWATFSFLLLAAGIVSLALSIVWRRPNILMNMVLSTADLTGIFLWIVLGFRVLYFLQLVLSWELDLS